MAIINWPSNIVIGPVDFGVEFDVQFSVFRDGSVKTSGLPGGRWIASLRFENDLEQIMRPRAEALLMSLRGGANQLSMPHWGRPRPNGTLTGNPTIGGAIAAGAQTFVIANANGTVKAGDIIGVLGQLVMVHTDASPVATNLTVTVSPVIRQVVNSGTPVIWNKPTALWIPRSPTCGPFPYAQGKFRPAFSIDLMEIY